MKIRHWFCLFIGLMAQPSYARDWVVFSESPSIKLEVATDEASSEPGIKRVGVRTQFLGKV